MIHGGTTPQYIPVKSYVYDSGTLAWVAMEQPLIKTDTLAVTSTTDLTKIGGTAVGVTNALAVKPGTAATFPVSGTFWQTTQPVSGTFWQTTQPVSATDLDIRNLVAATDIVQAKEYGDCIAQGIVTGVTPWSKIGYNAAITTEQDIAPWIGSGSTPALIYSFPTAELTMTIVSSSWKDCKRALTAFADSANHAGLNTLVTCAAHGLADGDIVIIEGTTSYNGTFTIEHTVVGAFEIVRAYVANDATGTVRGPGANTVTVYYLDDGFVEKSSTVTLLGQTPVNIAADMYRVQNARVATAGNSHAPVGNLTIANGGNTYGYISLGKTRQRQMTWTVPDGKTLYVNNISFSCGSQTASKNTRFTTRANYDEKSASLLDGIFMPYHEILLNNTSFNKDLNPPTKLIAHTDIKVAAYADSTAVVSCALRGYLVSA